MSPHHIEEPTLEQLQTLLPGVRVRFLPWNHLYAVAADGSVWSRQTTRRTFAANWRRLRVTQSTDGHLVVRICTNGIKRAFGVHRLVLEVFLGPCPPGMECCHGDGNPTNNVLGNLRWDTHQANVQEAYDQGALHRGSAHRCSRLTEQLVRQIREEVAKFAVGCQVLADRYGVSHQTIRAAIQRRTWKHVL
jgi:hypothetical protein